MRWSMPTALEDAGINRRVTPHGLRHSFCTMLALEGRSALEIAQRAGHAQSSTSERYIHLAEAARMETPAILQAMSEGLLLEKESEAG